LEDSQSGNKNTYENVSLFTKLQLTRWVSTSYPFRPFLITAIALSSPREICVPTFWIGALPVSITTKTCIILVTTIVAIFLQVSWSENAMNFTQAVCHSKMKMISIPAMT